MAWILLVVENLQQEMEIIKSDKALVFSSIGESLMSLIERMLRMQDLTMEQYQDLPLIKVYHRLVQVLMHSSDDSAIQLQRDGDPQVFEQILLDDGESKLKLKDISLPGKQGCEDTLRSYAFNLQRHTVEKVAAEIDNCMLVSRKDGKIENIQSKKEDWFASYKKKSSFFDVASNEHLREFKDEAYPADHHKISNTTTLKAEEKAAKKTEELAVNAEKQAAQQDATLGRIQNYLDRLTKQIQVATTSGDFAEVEELKTKKKTWVAKEDKLLLEFM
jgi:hypothetical protein